MQAHFREMKAMDFRPLIEKKRRRFEELAELVGSSSLFENPKRAREVMREHSNVKRMLESWDILEKKQRELEENRLLAAGDDSELAELAAGEIPTLEVEIENRSKEVQVALLPPEPHEDRDAIVEVPAGTGGSEAALFAADLYRMYSRYAESHGFKVEELESSPSVVGGLEEPIFTVPG